MADNASKLPLGGSDHFRTTRQIMEHLAIMQGKAPATIQSTDDSNTIATIKFNTDSQPYDLPEVKIPIQGDEYRRRPWKKGDKGYVQRADFDIGLNTGLGDQDPAQYAQQNNLASLIFHPLGNVNFSKTDDKEADVRYAPKGTIARDEKKKSQVKTHPDSGASISGGGDGNGSFDHSSTAGPDKVHHKSKKQVVTDAPDHTVTGNQNVAGNHDVGGNINAGGVVSGESCNFANGGSMGGIGIGGGGGGGGGGDVSGLTGAQVEGATDLPVYDNRTLALTALGENKLYIDRSVGAQEIAVGGGTIATTPSFFSQGIFVVCVTSHG